MPARKIAISMDPDLYEKAKAEAAREGRSMSAWLAGAARERLRTQALMDYLAAYQAEFGEFTEEELETALRPDRVTGMRQAS